MVPSAPPRSRRTARQHLETRVPCLGPGAVAADVREAALRPGNQVTDLVCVVDAARRLEGVVRVVDALAAEPQRPVRELLHAQVRAVRDDVPQEHVAHAALRSGVASVPVTDAQGRLVGVVPPLALLDTLYREHVEDLHRLAGIRREGEQARNALAEPPARRARHRLPWLLVGLGGSALAAVLVAQYETLLERRVAVAYFLPGIVYLADAIGTQTEAIAVRAFSFGVPPLARALWGEVRTGLWIGALLALIVTPAVAWGLGDVRLGAAVGLALFVAGALATFIGLLLPWALWRRGRDPAFGSGPLATVIQDVVSLLVYFLVVQALL